MTSPVQDVQINWPETIRSRLDMSSGGDEHEIQLISGSPVKAAVYRVARANEFSPWKEVFFRHITGRA